MKIILQEDVENLGDKGDIVEVADGYARNYLIPREMALEATEGKIKEVKHRQRRLEKKKAQKREEARELAKEMEEKTYEFQVKAGEKGRLFGSITSMDIADRLNDDGFKVSKKDIELSENIKSLGVHEVPVKLFKDINAEIKVKVLEE
ncbi:MAG: 50S ribosomal protein L9 [Halanaerobiaceae bacterium]